MYMYIYIYTLIITAKPYMDRSISNPKGPLMLKDPNQNRPHIAPSNPEVAFPLTGLQLRDYRGLPCAISFCMVLHTLICIVTPSWRMVNEQILKLQAFSFRNYTRSTPQPFVTINSWALGYSFLANMSCSHCQTEPRNALNT